MSARSEILGALRARKTTSAPKPAPYRAPLPSADLVTAFERHVGSVDGEVKRLESFTDIPGAIAEILRARNMAPAIHLPPDPELAALAWDNRIAINAAPPGPDDAAVAIAPFAIAETGTLVYPAREASPASWHFRPGLEIAILRENSILAHFEDVIARLKTKGLPSTVNLVTGPSRTGDIEQTLELGAHGPKGLVVLVVKGA